MSSEKRVCSQCGTEIGSLRSSTAKFCGRCREQNKRDVRRCRKELSLARRSIKAKQTGSVIFHSCLSRAEVDPFVPEHCRCRKMVSEEEAQVLVDQGAALDFASRLPMFSSGPIIQIGKAKRTPRSTTVEKAHIIRLVQRKAGAKKDKTLEQLKEAVARDKAERFEEEQLRLEIYGDIQLEFLKKMIVEIPA